MDATSGFVAGESTPLLYSSRPKKPALCVQLSSVLVACIGSLSVGMVLGYSSPALVELKTELTQEQASWFGSLPTLAALIGSPLGGLFLDLVGRRTALAFMSVPFVAGWLLIVYSQGYLWLYAGRFLTGIGIGMSRLNVSVYIGEVASKEYRGRLGILNQLGVSIGILIIYALPFIFRWRWMALASAAVSAMLLLGIVFVPDSPRWLLKHRYKDEAVKSLQQLRGRNYDIQLEQLEMETNIEAQSKEKFKLSYLRKSSVYKPLVILVILMAFKQPCGMGAMTFYAHEIFSTVNLSPNATPMIIGGVNVAGTIFSAFIIDKAGRRVLLITSGTILTLSSGGLGFYYYLLENQNMDLSWVCLVSVVCYFIGFSTGWGAIPWILLGELFPLKVRSAASSVSVFVNWISAFILVKEFSALEGVIHKYGAMWCFAGVSFVGVIFVAVFLPETKGKSLEEIEEYFEQSNNPSYVINSTNGPSPRTVIQGT